MTKSPRIRSGGNRLSINGEVISPGQRKILELPVTGLYTHTPLALPVQVINGKQAGPCLFICAAIHGDEVNGVEIIRRLLNLPVLNRLHGTLIAIPIVNIYGFIHHSRYLPDRRDLNRAFPGSESGSLTARLAHRFIHEIVDHCSHGIDLHTGTLHRANLPQIRANLDDPETERLARAFGVPVIVNADLRDGSLRQAASEKGIPTLLYEGGEALRFDELSIRAGERGIVSVMRALGMLKGKRKTLGEPFVARSSTWVRAPRSGILRFLAPLGRWLKKDELIGVVSDPFGQEECEVRAPVGGIVIGRSNIPLVNEGEALLHLARFQETEEVAASVEAFQAEYQDMEGSLPPSG